MMASVIRMPEVLTGISEAAIATWLVEPGQAVQVGTPLAEVETEKAVVEYAAEAEGTILEILVEAGSSTAIGDPIIVIGAPGESWAGSADPASPPASPVATPAAGDEPPPPPQPVAEEPLPVERAVPAASTPAAAPAPGAEQRRFATPLVRRLARERGIDLSAIAGSGPNGRIVRRDIDGLAATPAPEAAPPAAPAGAPTPAASAPADVEEIPLTGMRRAIARRLTESKSTVPHFYLVADCRVDELLALRREVNAAQSVKVSVNDFVMKAIAGALIEVPDANATWGGDVIHRHRTADIAVAVAIDGGLVTPVVRGVERLSLTEVARSIADLAGRAKAGRLKQHELEGGSFSVSNLGMYGVAEFSAIINPPHAGILAVGAARQVPVVEDGALAVGTVMTVTLSADHRVVDGAVGAQLLAAFQRRIEHPLTMLV